MRNRHVMLYDYNFFYLGICILPRITILVASKRPQMASMASEFKFDLKFEISNLNYPSIIVHVASNSHFGGL